MTSGFANHSIVSGPPYRPTFRLPQVPLPLMTHVRRFRYRQLESDGPLMAHEIHGPPPEYTPTLPLHAPTHAPVTIPAPAATAAVNPTSMSIPQLLQTPAGISGALIATGVLLGLAILVALLLRTSSHIASSFPAFVRKHLGNTRKVEQDMGFVMIEYDDSTWGMPAKTAAVRNDPEAARALDDLSRYPSQRDLFVPSSTSTQRYSAPPFVHTNGSTLVEDFKTVVEHRQRPLSAPVLPIKREYSTRNDLYTISEGDEQDLGDVRSATLSASSSAEESEPDYSQDAAEIAHALGLALQNYSSSASTLDSAPARARMASFSVSPQDTAAAVLALRAGMESVSVRARASGRPRKASDASTTLSGGGDSAEFSSSGSITSSGTSVGAVESGNEGDEEEVLFEVRRVETKSMDFKRGIVVSIATIADLEDKYGESQAPRVVVSASPSFDDRGHENVLGACGSDVSVSDFPSPPVLLDTVRTMSTSLTYDVERSLSMALSMGDPYFTKRVSSMPSRIANFPVAKTMQTYRESSAGTRPLQTMSDFDVFAM